MYIKTWKRNIGNEDLVNQKKSPGVKTYLCFGAILLLQHNSVWAATVAGVVIILLIAIKKNGFNKSMAIVGIILVFLCSLIIYLGSYNGVNLVLRSISNSLGKFDNMESGTIGHRKERWALLLDSLSGIEHLIGQSFSIGTNVGGVSFSAHNAYIAVIMHSGYLGLSFFVLVLFYLTLKSFFNKEYIFVAVIVSILVYWYAYEPDTNFGVLLGFIMYNINYQT